MEFISALMEGNFTAEHVNGLTEDLFPLATGLITEGIIDSHPEAAFYLALAVMVEGQPGVEPPVWLWLRGAAEVNIGVGNQANCIRNYNDSQAGARTGDSVPFDEISDISNIMAQRLFLDIKRSSGVIPNLNFIAENDARAAAGILFQDGDFGGWAGSPLFLALGINDYFNRCIVGDQNGTYDAFAMLKFMLESYQSANIVDALLQIYQCPDGADVAVTAVASLATFLEEHYGVDGTNLLAYLTVGTDIKLGRLGSDDTLSATDEMDAIHGGAGNDTVIGGSEQAGFFDGNDLLDGGDGLDKVNFNQAIETKALNKTFTSLGGGISGNISSVEIEKCVFLRFQVLKR